MKGDPQVIDALNRALTIELTAINQYFCQSKMCKNWGYLRIAAQVRHESIDEMKHADALDVAAVQANDDVSVLRFASVSVVHGPSPFLVIRLDGRRERVHAVVVLIRGRCSRTARS